MASQDALNGAVEVLLQKANLHDEIERMKRTRRRMIAGLTPLLAMRLFAAFRAPVALAFVLPVFLTPSLRKAMVQYHGLGIRRTEFVQSLDSMLKPGTADES